VLYLHAERGADEVTNGGHLIAVKVNRYQQKHATKRCSDATHPAHHNISGSSIITLRLPGGNVLSKETDNIGGNQSKCQGFGERPNGHIYVHKLLNASKFCRLDVSKGPEYCKVRPIFKG